MFFCCFFISAFASASYVMLTDVLLPLTLLQHTRNIQNAPSEGCAPDSIIMPKKVHSFHSSPHSPSKSSTTPQSPPVDVSPSIPSTKGRTPPSLFRPFTHHPNRLFPLQHNPPQQIPSPSPNPPPPKRIIRIHLTRSINPNINIHDKRPCPKKQECHPCRHDTQYEEEEVEWQ
jgi:hypothetical protein